MKITQPFFGGRSSPISSNRVYSTKLYSAPPLPDTSDPYMILNLKPTADKKEIKRAYKRMALKYHPDVRTNSKSTEEEKKQANDDFAKINSAYAFLTGKSDDRPEATESEKKSGSSGGGYTPPHRRTSSYSSGASTDWRDYMPKYDDETYDAGGDSFGSIFADLFSELGKGSAAGYAGSGVSILNDFISFLEKDFSSVGTSNAKTKEEDIILESLLKNGSLDEIKEEFKDAKLLVKQLEQKEFDLDVELKAVDQEKGGIDGGKGKTYMDDMRLEEKKREVEARKEVVADYLDRARMRQLKLRKRIDELRVENDFNSQYKNSSRTSSSSSSYNSYDASDSYSSRTASNSSSNSSDKDEDAWTRESFGSSRRRRGGGRTRSRRTSSQSETESTSRPPKPEPETPRRTYSERTTATSTSVSSSNNANIAPHRRLTSRYDQVQEDKRRLREIKVDEEIEKMKRELGL